MHRFTFFGRETVSFLVVLPIALPGIVTGIALNSAFDQRRRSRRLPHAWSIAHATFCIVVVYNNVIARLRRLSPERRGGVGRPRRRPVPDVPLRDVPAGAHRRCWPARCSPSRCSFDEIVVTTFTAGGIETLPQWIFNNIFPAEQRRRRERRGHVVVLLSIIPVWVAQKLTDGGGGGRGAGPSCRTHPRAVTSAGRAG